MFWADADDANPKARTMATNFLLTLIPLAHVTAADVTAATQRAKNFFLVCPALGLQLIHALAIARCLVVKPKESELMRLARWPAMLVLSVAALFLTPVHADDLVGPEAVWNLPLDPWCSSSEGFTPWIDCIAAQGAPAATLAVANYLSQSPPYNFGGIVTRFHELGPVDYAEIEFPILANTGFQIAMVNGDVPVLTGLMFDSSLPTQDSGTRRLLRVFPDAAPSGRYQIAAHRILPDDVQRFVVTDVLTSGCRACEIVGISITHVDFEQGRLRDSKAIGWVAYPNPVPSGWAARALLRGDELELQIRLHLRGYDAGSMDGIAGPATAEALSEFLIENCLPTSQTLTVSAIRILSSSNHGFEPAPCAP